MNPKISVVLPNLQEEAIFKVIEQFGEALEGEDYEIIVVNRSDAEYYNKLKATGVRIIDQKVLSVENAIMDGLAAAKGDILISTDADGTHGMEAVKPGLEIIRKGDVGLVLGNRFGDLHKGAMTSHIKFGNKFISFAYRLIYRKKIHDVLTGFFIMTRHAYEAMKEVKPYKAGIAFFAIEVAKRGFNVVELPISYYPRTSGKSKLAKSKLFYGFNVVLHIIRKTRDYNPILIFGGFGLLLVLVGSGMGIFVIWETFEAGTFTLIGRSLIAFMLFITGVTSIIAGFVIDLLLEIAKKFEKI